MKFYLFLPFLYFIVNFLQAQSKSAEVDPTIPVDPKKGAVYNLYKDTYYFKTYNVYKQIHEEIVTVYDEDGADAVDYRLYYSADSKYESIKAYYLKMDGSVQSVFDLEKMGDEKHQDYMSFIDDNRFKTLDLRKNLYPYKVKLYYEFYSEEPYLGEFWTALPRGASFVEKSILNIYTESASQLNVWVQNHPITGQAPEILKQGLQQKYTFENLSEITRQYCMPEYKSYYPSVKISPNFFYEGKKPYPLKNWTDFGDFFYELNDNQLDLPEKTKMMVLGMTNGKSDREKVDILYQYVQKNTRYVLVNLGIGGWKSYPASYVDERKYGDCKALTNYMRSLLSIVNIPSNYTLVLAGDDNITSYDKDVVLNNFNHVILNVPLGQDTVWLECTSNTLPSGFLSDFTSDRPVLVCKKTDSHWAYTPRTKAEENNSTYSYTADYSSLGTQVDAKVIYKGNKYQSPYFNRLNSTDAQFKEYMVEKLPISNADFLSLNTKVENITPLPTFTVEAQIKSNHLFIVSGKRFFIDLKQYIPAYSWRKEEKRNFDYNLGIAESQEYRLEIKIPEGYIVENLPSQELISTEMGTFSMISSFENQVLKIHATLTFAGGLKDAKNFEAFNQLTKSIESTLKKKVGFVKP